MTVWTSLIWKGGGSGKRWQTEGQVVFALAYARKDEETYCRFRDGSSMR